MKLGLSILLSLQKRVQTRFGGETDKENLFPGGGGHFWRNRFRNGPGRTRSRNSCIFDA